MFGKRQKCKKSCLVDACTVVSMFDCHWSILFIYNKIGTRRTVLVLGAGVLSYSSRHIYIVHTVEWMAEKLCMCVCVHIHVCV